MHNEKYLRGDAHIDFSKFSVKMTLLGGWVNCCDANFVTFFYRFFRRSIIQYFFTNEKSDSRLAKYSGSVRKQSGYSAK